MVDLNADRLMRRGVALERATLGWNVVGIAVLGPAALSARSVALAGFALDSLIEIAASAVVLWELAGTGDARQERALRLIGISFLTLAGYLAIQSAVVLATDHHARHSPTGIAWTTATVLVMTGLARGKARTGSALGNLVLTTEARVTYIDALLAASVLLGLLINAVTGAWWADPTAGLVIVYYGLREAHTCLRAPREPGHPLGTPGTEIQGR